MASKEELKQLREIADAMGLKYPITASAAKLRKLIDEAEASENNTTTTKPADGAVSLKDDAKARQEYIAEKTKLVRIVITPNSPRAKSIQGDWFSVGNAILPTYRKFLLFNAPDGYHVPQYVYDSIKEIKYREERTVTPKDGRPKYIENFELPAYNITVLPQLTEEELEDLRQKQLMTK